MTESQVEAEATTYVFENKKLEALTRIIEEEVVVEKPGRTWIKDYEVDTNRAIAILSEFETDESEPDKLEIDQKEAERVFREVVKSFVDHGIVDPQTALLVGRLVRPSDSKLIDEAYLRFLYMDDEFPKNKEGRADMELGHWWLTGSVPKLRQILREANIDLSTDEIRGIALRWGVSHEYGHAVDYALQLREAEKRSENGLEKEAWELVSEVRRERYQALFKEAPSQELAAMFAIGTHSDLYVDATDTSSERIAGGFERLGLRFALEEVNIPSDKIDAVLEIYRKTDKKNFQDLQYLKQVGIKKGVDMTNIGIILNEVALALRRTDKPGLGKKVLPLKIGASYAGYLFPLTEGEIQRYIRGYFYLDK